MTSEALKAAPSPSLRRSSSSAVSLGLMGDVGGDGRWTDRKAVSVEGVVGALLPLPWVLEGVGAVPARRSVEEQAWGHLLVTWGGFTVTSLGVDGWVFRIIYNMNRDRY